MSKPHKLTGANAGELRSGSTQTRWAGRVAQFYRQAAITMFAPTRIRGMRICVLAFILCFSIDCARGASMVCRAQQITGFEPEYEVGKLLLGSATSDVSHCKLYITVSRGFLYVHSNYLDTGHDYPVKLAIDEEVDLETIVLNIVYDKPPADFAKAIAAVHQAIEEKIQFYVDKRLIASSRFSKLDFSRVKNVVWDPPRPREVGILQRAVDLKAQVKIPGNQPLATPTASSSNQSSSGEAPKRPEDFYQVAIALLWDSLWGRVVLTGILVLGVLVVVWATFPDSIKEHILTRLFGLRRRPRRNARTQDDETKA